MQQDGYLVDKPKTFLDKLREKVKPIKDWIDKTVDYYNKGKKVYDTTRTILNEYERARQNQAEHGDPYDSNYDNYRDMYDLWRYGDYHHLID